MLKKQQEKQTENIAYDASLTFGGHRLNRDVTLTLSGGGDLGSDRVVTDLYVVSGVPFVHDFPVGNIDRGQIPDMKAELKELEDYVAFQRDFTNAVAFLSTYVGTKRLPKKT